jgi:hypothetical protein
MKPDAFVSTAVSRRGLFGICAGVIALPLLPAAARRADGRPNSHRQDPGAKTFLESIYKKYVGSSTAAGGVPLASANTVRSYFTAGLASLILEDRAAAAKRGDVPALDSDPFIGGQDWDISNLSVDVKEAGALKAVGTVTFMNSGKPGKVTVELLRSGVDWRIADIAWESGSLRGLYRRKATREGDPAPR